MARLELEKGLLYIEEDDEGQRLDRLLVRLLDAPHSLIDKLIRKGNVRLNRKRTQPSARVQAGDLVFLPASLRVARTSSTEAPPKALLARIAQLAPIAEGPTWLAFNKPAGMPVHGGSRHPWGFIELLRALRDEPELRLVHRLDRDTTGVLLIARGPRAARELARAFAERSAHKRYLAWTLGAPESPQGEMFARLKKGQLRGGERMVSVHGEGKPARTQWRLIGRWRLCIEEERTSCALLCLQPESGRTHQLRVQLANAKLSILGDAKYGGRHAARLWQRIGGVGIALHAWQLALRAPNGEQLLLRAPVPAYWQAVRRYFR